MRARRSGIFLTTLVTATLLAAGLTGSTMPAARAADMASCMPAETAVYIGWSAWYEPNSPEVTAGRKLLGGIMKQVVKWEDQELPPWADKAADAAMLLNTCSGGIGLFDVVVADEKWDVQVALVLDAGEKSAGLADALLEIIRDSPLADELGSRTVLGVKLQDLGIPDTPLHLLWGTCEGRFLAALGEPAAGKVIECLTGKAKTLAKVDELGLLRQKTRAHLDGRFFCAYVDVPRILSRGKAIWAELAGEVPPMVDQVLTELGLDTVRGKYLHHEEQGGNTRCAAFAHLDGPPKGLMKIWDQAPLTDDDLRILPADAYWAYASNLDLGKLWEEAQRIIEALSPDTAATVDGALAMTTPILGFSLTTDLLPAFGDTWALFDAPDHGGILLTGTVLVAEIREQEALEGMLGRLVQLAGAPLAQARISLVQKELKEGPHSVKYVMVGGAPVPVAPAWGFVDGRFVFGLYPQTVCVAMSQVDPKTRKGSLLDQAEVKAARASMPKEINAFGYCDSRYFTRLLYPLMNGLKTMGASMGGPTGGGIDFALMPTLPVELAGVRNAVGVTSTERDGVLMVSSGDAVPLPVVVGTAAMAASVLLPSVSRGREQAKRAVSSANLRGIGMAMKIYAVDNLDQYPASFQVLIDDGSITPKMLESPRQPPGVVSYVYIAGQGENVDVRNVLAYERLEGNEGTNVLFQDAHVEWMKPDAFRQAVRDTYRRLKREAEMPPEFGE